MFKMHGIHMEADAVRPATRTRRNHEFVRWVVLVNSRWNNNAIR
jgi:hypothetical protein